MTTRLAEAHHARLALNGSGTFSDWRRYRSAFSEAIELPAMSEQPVRSDDETVQPAVAGVKHVRQALSGHLRTGSPVPFVASLPFDASLNVSVRSQAAHRYSPAQVNTRRSSNDDPERYQPQIIFSTLRPVAVIALLPAIFSIFVLW